MNTRWSGCIKSSLFKLVKPLCRSLPYSFFKAVLDGSSKNFSRRFFKNYKEFLSAMVREAKDRETRAIRTTIEDYLTLRRYSGAFIPVLDMILLPLDIPDSVLADPRIKQLEMMAIEMVAVANVSTHSLGTR
jgi:hypothetical protein